MPRPDAAAVRAYAAEHSPGLVKAAYLACGDWDRAADLVRAALVRGYGRRGDGVARRVAGDFPERAGGPLGGLPPRQRAVLALRQGLGLTVERTAATLGTSEGAVRQLGSRAAGTLPAEDRAALEAVVAGEPPVAVDPAAVERDWRARLRRRRALLGAVALVAAGSATAAAVAVSGGSGGTHAAAPHRPASPATPSPTPSASARHAPRTTFVTTPASTALQDEMTGLLRAATGRDPASLTADQLADASGRIIPLPELEADAEYLLGEGASTEKVSVSVSRPGADAAPAGPSGCATAGTCATH